MSNDIPTRQNKQHMLDNKAASSEVYHDAKRLSSWQTYFAIASAVLVPALAWAVPATHVWGGLFVLLVFSIDMIFLEPAVKRRQQIGAKIQEMFDTHVLHLEWNPVRVGARPDPETVAEAAERFKQNKQSEPEKLKDWYPVEVGDVPLEYARFICQRANMRWDAALRRDYCFWFVVMLVGLVFGGALFAVYMGVFNNWGVVQLVMSVALPLAPAFGKIWRERNKHMEAAESSERVKQHLESAWSDAMKKDMPVAELEHLARLIQDELYDRRKGTPSVPEFLYKRSRESYENQMKAAAALMVSEAHAKSAANAPVAPPTTPPSPPVNSVI